MNRPTYTSVASTLAVLIALAGTSYVALVTGVDVSPPW